MKFQLLTLPLLSSIISIPSDIGRPTARIVAGHEAPKFAYPWLVNLQLFTWQVCGGTLINSNTVLTAAHCMIGEKEDWTVYAHRHNLTDTTENENGKEYKVLDRFMHPKYIDSPTGYDISVWKIDAPLAGNYTQIEFDTEGLDLKVNTLLKVAGWGTIAKKGAVSPILLETKLPVFDFQKCKDIYKQLDQSEFCAGYIDGSTDTCQGDSGGPIFTTKDKVPKLVGIISRGEGCAKVGYPGVYTSLQKVRDFVDQYL